jgi:hypothetical protein
MKRHDLTRLALVLTPLVLFLGTAPVWADDMSVVADFDCVGSGVCEQTSEHEDADPFKGWANITVTNTGTEAWGDFHFLLFQVTNPIDNVDFIVDSPYQPTSSQSGLSWDVDNDVVGATLDLFFYSDPVLPSEVATFRIYTDNTTDQVSFFGMAFYPTPVPEPGTFALLAAGLIGLAAFRKRS